MHALKDPGFGGQLRRFIRAGKPVLLTDGLAARLTNQVDLTAQNVQVLPVEGVPESLLALSQEVLHRLREPLLRPFETSLRASNQVGLYLFMDGGSVIEHFNDQPSEAELNGRKLAVESRAWQTLWK